MKYMDSESLIACDMKVVCVCVGPRGGPLYETKVYNDGVLLLHLSISCVYIILWYVAYCIVGHSKLVHRKC